MDIYYVTEWDLSQTEPWHWFVAIGIILVIAIASAASGK
jgi:hypothetical protein